MKSTAWISTRKATGLRQQAGTIAFASMIRKLSRLVTVYSILAALWQICLQVVDIFYIISGTTISHFTNVLNFFVKTSFRCFPDKLATLKRPICVIRNSVSVVR